MIEINPEDCPGKCMRDKRLFAAALKEFFYEDPPCTIVIKNVMALVHREGDPFPVVMPWDDWKAYESIIEGPIQSSNVITLERGLRSEMQIL